MSYKRLTPIYTDGKGLPREGQVFSLVSSRQTVWAQRQGSEHVPDYKYALVGILPSDPDGKFALVKGQAYAAFERGVAERHQEDIVKALRPEFSDDVRFV